MPTPSFLTSVQDGIRKVESLMQSQSDGYHPDLKAALGLLISSGGKRIRPALTLITGKMLGADEPMLVVMAAAIELLHTATLVHDDLIDASLLRRGNPTLNSKWSPGATVLTGDFMFARAAKLASDTNSVPVIRLFAQTLTTIVNGELTQLFTSRCRLDREGYYRRIYSKTASLFETSTASAALISQAESEQVESVRLYGYQVGMAFQIIDDILDFTSEETVLGKPVGSDLRQGIITLPTILYAEAHPENPSVEALQNGRCITDELEVDRLIASIRKSRAIKQSHQEACKFARDGIAALERLPAFPELKTLEELANYIVERDI